MREWHKNTLLVMPFTTAAYRFLRGIKRNNNKAWFEAHRDEYERDLREPMRALIVDMDKRFARFAPELMGDPADRCFASTGTSGSRRRQSLRCAREAVPWPHPTRTLDQQLPRLHALT